MRLSPFLLLKAAVTALFGVLFLLVPVWSMSLFGATLDPAGVMMTRFFGAAFIGVSLICFFTSRATASPLRQDVVLSLFVLDTLGFVLALIGQLNGVFNALGWVIVVIWLFFAAGLGYFRFLRP